LKQPALRSLPRRCPPLPLPSSSPPPIDRPRKGADSRKCMSVAAQVTFARSIGAQSSFPLFIPLFLSFSFFSSTPMRRREVCETGLRHPCPAHHASMLQFLASAGASLLPPPPFFSFSASFHLFDRDDCRTRVRRRPDTLARRATITPYSSFFFFPDSYLFFFSFFFFPLLSTSGSSLTETTISGLVQRSAIRPCLEPRSKIDAGSSSFPLSFYLPPPFPPPFP